MKTRQKHERKKKLVTVSLKSCFADFAVKLPFLVNMASKKVKFGYNRAKVPAKRFAERIILH